MYESVRQFKLLLQVVRTVVSAIRLVRVSHQHVSKRVLKIKLNHRFSGNKYPITDINIISSKFYTFMGTSKRYPRNFIRNIYEAVPFF